MVALSRARRAYRGSGYRRRGNYMYSALVLGAAIILHSSRRTPVLHPLNAAPWIMRGGHEPEMQPRAGPGSRGGITRKRCRFRRRKHFTIAERHSSITLIILT